jgi:hypothetical protein
MSESRNLYPGYDKSASQYKFQKIFWSNAFKLRIAVTLNKDFRCLCLLLRIPFKLISIKLTFPIFNQINLLPIVGPPEVIVGVYLLVGLFLKPFGKTEIQT